jgi:hypothetical protein
MTQETLGLDVSDKYSHYCRLDSSGAIIEEGRIQTTAASFRQHFTGEPCRVVVEAGTHSPWIRRFFAEVGFEIIVANPRRVQLIGQATKKNDRSDAEVLARLGRMDPKLLAPITHRDLQAQADLAVIRGRHALINSRSLLINHVRGAVKALGARLPACDAQSFHRRVRGILPPELEVALNPLLESIEHMTAEVKKMDRPHPRADPDSLPSRARPATGRWGRTSNFSELHPDHWRPLPIQEESRSRSLPRPCPSPETVRRQFTSIAHHEDGRQLLALPAREWLAVHPWFQRTGL